MKVAAFPAFKSKQNPYQSLLYAAMQKDKVEVEEFHWKNIFYKTYDIIHIHWPESNKLRKTVMVALSYTTAFNFLLKAAKRKGAKVVWTVHNLQSHERKFPLLEKIHFRFFTKMVDGVIVMNNSTLEKLIIKYPYIKSKPFKVIPHGHYKDWYKNDISAVQAKNYFGLKITDPVFLVLGMIKPYKGLENIIEYFIKSLKISYKLIIAGRVQKEAFYYKEMLEKLINNDERIIFKPEFIPDDDLQNYFNAADLVLLPYNNMLNSGVLLLALSFNKTILMPYFEGVVELIEKYKAWILTYKILDNNIINEALIKAQENKKKKVDMEDRSWDKIALATTAFFKSLM